MPFLKWPGGKRWIAPFIAELIAPWLTGRYYEPFLGGAAVFFALRPSRATLSDINPDLINTFRQVRDHDEEIIAELKGLTVSRASYYRIRSNAPTGLLDSAIRFLYLNRTAFGGIYRLNRSGEFNVPYGGGERTPATLWRDGLMARAAAALRPVKLVVCDFEKIIDQAGAGDSVYCDPTYTVTHENNGFVRYNERNFSWADQERLAAAALRASVRGALVIVSNACHKSLLPLYDPFWPLEVMRQSSVSRNPEDRRSVCEYVFVIYPQDSHSKVIRTKSKRHSLRKAQ